MRAPHYSQSVWRISIDPARTFLRPGARFISDVGPMRSDVVISHNPLQYLIKRSILKWHVSSTYLTLPYLTCMPWLASGKKNTLSRNKTFGLTHQISKVGTMGVDGWAATFGTARRGLGEAAAHPSPSSLYQM